MFFEENWLESFQKMWNDTHALMYLEDFMISFVRYYEVAPEIDS